MSNQRTEPPTLGAPPVAVAPLTLGAPPVAVAPLTLGAPPVAVAPLTLGAPPVAVAPLHPFVGGSPRSAELRETIAAMADSHANVLIHGESGTGKEVVAKCLHALGPRANHPFVAVNCAAFPEALLEAELFGHEKGAFTGAFRKRTGRFQLANRGTLFLDEVAEIPLNWQAKLLRVLEEKAFEPLGTNQTIHVDVRIVAATHRDLKQRVVDGLFREDLYFRLRVLDLHIPPLRERMEDLDALVPYLLSRLGFPHREVATNAWNALRTYKFPGNVRELEHALQHGTVLSRGGVVDATHLPTDIFPADATLSLATPPASVPATPLENDVTSTPHDAIRPLNCAMRDFERTYLARALKETGGHRGNAARLLGISRKNLWEKLRACELAGEHDTDQPHSGGIDLRGNATP